MSNHHVYHLSCGLFESPIAVKLNLQDHYVRIAAPYYELIHLHHQLFNNVQVEVSNVYGVPLFTIAASPNTDNEWTIHQKGHRSFKICFSGNAEGTAKSNDHHHSTIHFNVLENEGPTNMEKQMIGAALANCYFQHHYAKTQHAVYS